jgi:hypothetical protein
LQDCPVSARRREQRKNQHQVASPSQHTATFVTYPRASQDRSAGGSYRRDTEVLA